VTKRTSATTSSSSYNVSASRLLKIKVISANTAFLPIPTNLINSIPSTLKHNNRTMKLVPDEVHTVNSQVYDHINSISNLLVTIVQ